MLYPIGVASQNRQNKGSHCTCLNYVWQKPFMVMTCTYNGKKKNEFHMSKSYYMYYPINTQLNILY